MDRAEFVKQIDAEVSRLIGETARHVHEYFTHSVEGDHEEAAKELAAATLTYARYTALDAVLTVESTEDRVYAATLEALKSKDMSFWVAQIDAARAKRAFREFKAAWAMFADEGVRLGPELLEKLYAIPPEERERKIRGFAPEETDIVNQSHPCSHDEAPVIPPTYRSDDGLGYCVTCTECSRRFPAERLGSGEAILSRVVQPETANMQAVLVKVTRPFVRA